MTKDIQFCKKDYAHEYERIGEKISYIRKCNHLTQKEVGKRVGISTSYIAKIEGSKSLSGLSLDMFFAICQGIDSDPVTILRKDPEDELRTKIRQNTRQRRLSSRFSSSN
ncbi:MAG: helix-turn-helix transcriptional regulator [Veillonella sp.]|nr:helix-turn-helix transcriptional regulator [Veillonella sp.]